MSEKSQYMYFASSINWYSIFEEKFGNICHVIKCVYTFDSYIYARIFLAEMFVRTNLVNNSNAKPHKLHIESIKYVKAKAQAETLEKIHDCLTEKEREIVSRGRNTENHHVAKNANVADYSQSTGFEALIGCLYLTRQDERLEEILNMCIE